jgi:hypothetical protein
MPEYKVSSWKGLQNKILDFEKIFIKRITRKDKIDHDFIAKVKNLKTANGLLDKVKKPYYEEKTIDKLLLYYQVDKAMHLKIDRNLLPKKKQHSYLEAVEPSGNTG